MKIKILAGEHLFNEQGTHVCDSNGIALRAVQDVEVDVAERVEIVLELIKNDRLNRGLDENGDPIPKPVIEQPAIEEPAIEEPVSPSPAIEE